MDRITDKHLEALCSRLNTLTGSPLQPYARDEAAGRSIAQVGNFHVSHAYGGVCLHRMSNTGGGVSTPLMGGHVTKRQLYDAMYAMISGIEMVKHNEVKVA